MYDDTFGSTASLRPSTEDGADTSPFLILLVQCEQPMAPSLRIWLGDVDEIVVGRSREPQVIEEQREGRRVVDVRVPDSGISSAHARIFRSAAQWAVEDLQSKNGIRINGLARPRAALRDGDVLQLGYTFFMYREYAVPRFMDVFERTGYQLGSGGSGAHTHNVPLSNQLNAVRAATQSSLPVLIEGESGTGRATLVKGLHELSGRSGPLSHVRCATASVAEIEALLLATNDEQDRTRPLRLARQELEGTVWLDEVSLLSAAAQAALLALLSRRDAQEQEVPQRAAGLGLPVIATTRFDLDQLVAEGKLDPDLAGRLRGHRVRLPPLRERKEDLGSCSRRCSRPRPPVRTPSSRRRSSPRCCSTPGPGTCASWSSAWPQRGPSGMAASSRRTVSRSTSAPLAAWSPPGSSCSILRIWPCARSWSGCSRSTTGT
jgi:hypothetical protein